jgi:hypothetical protein
VEGAADQEACTVSTINNISLLQYFVAVSSLMSIMPLVYILHAFVFILLTIVTWVKCTVRSLGQYLHRVHTKFITLYGCGNFIPNEK